LPSSDEKFAEIFEQAKRHLDALHRHSATNIEHASFFEFGAGFELGIPLSFQVLGVSSQVVVDIRRLLRIELVNETIRKLKRINGESYPGRSPEAFLDADRSDRWVDLLQQRYGIRYMAPCDARSTGLEQASIDFVTSTNTLEHIPEVDIRLILRECRRLLKDNGLISFIIDYKDHYSYSDRRITAYNFLKYSDSVWCLYSPALHYQNRLRHTDYLRLIREEGFQVLEENLTKPSESDLACLRATSIWEPFRERYDISDLGIRGAHVVACAAS
jgi:SAM-dependent methyltransferase